MDLSSLGLFRAMKGKMDWLTQRQEVLAQNVANADTPHYEARDLAPFDFKAELRRSEAMALRTTDVRHSEGAPRVVGAGPMGVKDRKSYEVNPTGNGVVLEEQMMKTAETAADYQMLLNLYRKQVGMIRTALGRGGV
ncbi:MAG TPA: flagellar basal body rod protein FlgB [Alphaproteobacteria bacterium]|nr:flagellar basal body rod protein FlgB [Alphaproteobacteria bacterium]